MFSGVFVVTLNKHFPELYLVKTCQKQAIQTCEFWHWQCCRWQRNYYVHLLKSILLTLGKFHDTPLLISILLTFILVFKCSNELKLRWQYPSVFIFFLLEGELFSAAQIIRNFQDCQESLPPTLSNRVARRKSPTMLQIWWIWNADFFLRPCFHYIG